jgi:competence protein ComEC
LQFLTEDCMTPLLFPLLAFVAGIVSLPYLDPTPVWWCLPVAMVLAAVRRPCALIALFLFGAGLRSLEPVAPPDPGTDPARVVGRLTGAPEWRGLGVYLNLRLETVDGRPTRGRVRLTEFLEDPELLALFNALDLGSGDRLEILVKLHRPVVYRDPGVFDFRRYLERQGIYWTGTIRNPRLIAVVSRGWHGPDHIQQWIENRVGKPFESDPAVHGLVMGMVLGRKYDLTAETERQFQAGGLYHLVVVSGFNLAVVASATAWIVRFVVRKRRTRLLFIMIAVIAYSMVVGAQTPVVRAAVMAAVLIVGKALDRGYSPLNALALSAFVILLADPTAIEDSSFQMTFAAVAAVVVAGAPAVHWIFGNAEIALRRFEDVSLDGRLPPNIADWRVSRRLWCELHGLPYRTVTIPWQIAKGIGEALVMSVAVETLFMYFMVEAFHRFSPFSPLLNAPAGVLAGLITSAGLLLIVVPPPFAGIPAWFVRELVRLLIWMLDATLKLPHASLRVPSAPIALWFAYGGAAVIIVLAVHRKKRFTCLAAVAGALVLLGLILFGDFSPTPPKHIVTTFLDVGQGDSALVEFPDGRRMLIDGGGVAAGRFLGLRDESAFSIGEDVVSAYLFARRIRRLDVVALTHAHNDHMDGLFDVVANFSVGEVWLGRNPMITAYKAFISEIQTRQIPIRWVSRGQKLGEWTVLHPPASWKPRKNGQNNDSVVLLLQAGRQTALFTGDLEISIPTPEYVDVLKVPHHGSGGTRLRVRSAVRVISVGANNPFGHPHPSSLPALRTDQRGAIQVTFVGDRTDVVSQY